MKKIVFFLFFLAATVMAQNYSLVFDGTEDYVEFASSPAYSGTITIEAWIKTFSTEVNDIICWESTSDYSNVQFRIASGKLEFGTHSDGGTWISTSSSQSVNNGEWVHVAVTVNGSAIQLYINGVAENSGTNNNSMTVNTMYIGQYSNAGYHFDGSIDQVRIWNNVRTEAEIRQNMYHELADPASEANLVACYQFNETSGTTLTDSKASYNGTLTNMAGTEWQPSSAMSGPKNCLDFDGTDDYIEATINSSPSSTVTVECMVLFNSLTNQQNLIYLAQGQSNNCRIVPYKDAANEINLFICDASLNQVAVHSGYTVSAGVWYHLCFVYDNRDTKIYINGKLEASEIVNCNYSLDGSDYLSLGSDNGSILFICPIKFDQVRIWNTARTATEIRENMCKSLAGNESGLITYYTFDSISGTTLPDYTGNGNDGTLANMDGSTDCEASAAFNTWLNTPSTDWSTAANWSNGVPAEGDNVGIYDYGNGYNEPNIPASQTFHNLYLGSNTSTTLTSAMTVNGSLVLERNLDLNGHTITLGPSGELVEGDGLLTGTSGNITTTRALSNIDENIAGLGAVITTVADMGSTTITRTHTSAGGNVTSSVLRQYEITPTTNTGLDATLEFNYLDNELNGLNEMDLKLIKSSNNGTTWSIAGGIVSTIDNTVTLAGIGAFSNWTLAESVTQPTTNNALDFDGTDDYIDCGFVLNPNTLSSLTLEAWVYIIDDGFHRLFSQDYIDESDAGAGWFSINSGSHYPYTYLHNNQIESANTGVAENEWTHIALVWDGSTITFYHNGIEDGTVENVTELLASDNDMYLGWQGHYENTQFNGKMDEVRIWNIARTPEQIREYMTRTLNGNETGLVAYYPLNETSSTTASDATKNGYNGTLTNMDGDTDWVDSEAFTTWLGGTSNAWSSASNWTDGVPTATDNAGIYKWDDGSEAAISGSPTVNNLLISSTSAPTLSSGITVNSSLLVEKNMDLNGQTVTLGPNATLVEGSGVFSGTSGSITTTRSLSNIDENIAGLGAAITEDGELGNTTITRGHTSQGTGGINRYYQITTTNAPTDATLVFNYLDSELNGTTEADLDLYKSVDGNSWAAQGATLNTGTNTLTLSGINSFSDWTAGETGFGTSVRLQAKIFLQGPYDAGNDEMTTALKTAGVIPTTSPYSDDERTISSIPENIVDWVLVQLRSTSDGSAVASKSALLHKDGRIVGDDGSTSYINIEADAGDYFIVIRHRNHIAVMSDQAHTLGESSSTLYDFTIDESTAFDKYYNGDAALLETGIYGMYSGDADGLGSVDASDRVLTWNNRNNTGYEASDCNLSGTVDASDRVITWNNRNITTNLP